MDSRNTTVRVASIFFAFACGSLRAGTAPDFEPSDILVSSYFTSEIHWFDRAGTHKGVVEAAEILGPEGLAFGPNGTLYVASRDNDRVVGIVSQGLGNEIIDLPEFDSPVSVAFGPTGNLYVACAGNGRIVECTLAGAFVRSIGAGSGLSAPHQIVFGPEGHLFAADTATDLVYEFDPSGTLLRTFGGGELGSPVGIARAPGGSRDLWVTSLDDDAIDCLEPDGTGVASFSHASLDGPRQMVGGPDGMMYVASDVNDRVIVFDPVTRQFVKEIGTGSGLSGVGGVAFAPTLRTIRLKGRLAVGNDFEKVSQDAYVRYAPGSGVLTIGFYTPPLGQPSFYNEFGSHHLVIHCVEQSSGTSMLVSGAAVTSTGSGAGIGFGDLILLGKRGADGMFRVKEARGTLHRSGFGAQLSVRVTDASPQGGGK